MIGYTVLIHAPPQISSIKTERIYAGKRKLIFSSTFDHHGLLLKTNIFIPLNDKGILIPIYDFQAKGEEASDKFSMTIPIGTEIFFLSVGQLEGYSFK